MTAVFCAASQSEAMLEKLFVAWQHQAITWTNVEFSSLRSNDIHMKAILQETPQPSVTEISLKITWNFIQISQEPIS